ncbi:MAG: serine/threonine-protein kinase [Planctomycetota bacterium]
MAVYVLCPTCARNCRRDRADEAGRILCSACATEFIPDGTSSKKPTTVSLAGVADDFETKLLPTVVPKAAHLSHIGLPAGVTLAPDASIGSTSGQHPRRTVAELLHDGHDEKYIVDQELGRGGMGAVLRVVDRDLHRDVAMKVLIGEQSPRDRRRFVEEAQITGQLEHPNIVPVHDIGVDANQRLYFTMKLVRGRSLSDVIDLVRSNAPEAAEFSRFRLLRIFIQVCNAVAFAHARGVVHRDLKPSNVMLGDFGEVLLADWGLARILPQNRKNTSEPHIAVKPTTTQRTSPLPKGPKANEAEDRLAAVVKSFRRPVDSAEGKTVQGTVEGTPVYMPPEQARGDLDRIDERSDIYALGAILYEILTMFPPVGGRDVDEVLDNVINHRIRPPGARAPERDIPLDLSAITLKALSAEREHRYQTVIELRQDIEAHLEFRSVSARDDTATEMLMRLIRRHRAAVVVGLVSCLLLAVVLVLTFRTIRLERDLLATEKHEREQ